MFNVRLFALAQRQDPLHRLFLGAMDTPMIHIHLTVEAVLQKWPQVFAVFVRNKTKCPGCLMQHFCTLKDVAETYQIPPEKLITEIENVSREAIISKGVSHEKSI